MDIRKQFAVNLVNLMHTKGKRQQDLINDLGYSSSTVSQWCTGKNIPRISRIEHLARYFGVPVDTMYAGAELPMQVFSENTPTNCDTSLFEMLRGSGVREVTFKF